MITPAAQNLAQSVLRGGGRVLAIGNSLTQGTSTFSGWRSPFARVVGELLGGLQAYGTFSTNQDDLGRFGRYWLHDGVGAETLAQSQARLANAIATHRPDMIIFQGGENEGGTEDAVYNAWKAVDAEIARLAPGIPVAYIGRSARGVDTTHTGNRAILIDSNSTNGVRGFDRFIEELYGSRSNVIAINPHRYAHNRWTDFMLASGDAVHYNTTGYLQMIAIPLARAIFGDAAFQAPTPRGTLIAPNLSARIDIPTGGVVTKINATDTFYVTFANGATTLIPASYPVGTIPGHALVLHADGAGLGAFTPTIGAGGIAYSPYSWATRL